jgi:1-acyl-sn-glycerol-3-phosphate acyltransferase
MGFIVMYAVWATLHRYLKLPAIILEWHRKYYGRFTMKFCFDLHENFDQSQFIDTPIIVSNHVTYHDIIYYGTAFTTQSVSFVAKKAVMDLPFIGATTSFLQCITVDRNSA